MAEWKNLGDKAKNLTLAGLGKAKDLGESAKLNLENVSEEEGKFFVTANPIPPGEYEKWYQQLAEIDARIDANNARLAQLKDND